MLSICWRCYRQAQPKATKSWKWLKTRRKLREIRLQVNAKQHFISNSADLHNHVKCNVKFPFNYLEFISSKVIAMLWSDRAKSRQLRFAAAADQDRCRRENSQKLRSRCVIYRASQPTANYRINILSPLSDAWSATREVTSAFWWSNLREWF